VALHAEQRDGLHHIWIATEGGEPELVYNRTDVLYRSIQGHGIAKLKVRTSLSMFGASNSGLLGKIFVMVLLYHTTDGGHSYVTLRNLSQGSCPLLSF
jgi:hypothetical protein